MQWIVTDIASQSSRAPGGARATAREAMRVREASITAALAHNHHIDEAINIACGGLTDIAATLVELTGLAGATFWEQQVRRSRIDAALRAIDRVARFTQFRGSPLLDGTFACSVGGHDGTADRDLAIEAVVTTALGSAADGALSRFGAINDPATARRIIDAALRQVAQLRARLSAFQAETLAPAILSLDVALENISAADGPFHSGHAIR